MVMVPLPQHHDMVDALAQGGPDQTFDMIVLSLRAWRDLPVANAKAAFTGWKP